MSATIRVRSVANATDTGLLMRYLRENEPATSPMLADVLLLGLARRHGRAWIAIETDSAGEHERTVGVVCFSRPCIDMWMGSAHLIEPSAAEELARVVDRGWTWTVHGPRRSMELLRPHLRRFRNVVTMPWIVLETPIELVDHVDPRGRVASVADLPALVELYGQYELPVAYTRWQARRVLKRNLEHGIVIVCEIDGTMAAALCLSNSTGRYRAVSRLTVLPQHRRLGLSWALMSVGQPLVNAEHVGATVALAPSNPIDFSTRTTFEDAEWQTLQLYEPVRFRGHGRLRRLSQRILPTRARPVEYWQERSSSSEPDPERETGSG